MPIRFLTSGESHGKCLNAIIEGIPAGFELDIDFINSELKARQQGYGRGGRMKIETDTVKFNSGVRFGITTGAPVCIEIENKDWENWIGVMSPDAAQIDPAMVKEREIHTYRPGHADFAGCEKYNQEDIRNVLERSSARETATRTAVGAIAQNILSKFEIIGKATTLSIGGIGSEDEVKTRAAIDKAKEQGVSLGGIVQVCFSGLPVGLGSFTHWDRRLDGLLAQAIMSIPAIKSVEFGLGSASADLAGDKVHDELFFENGELIRKTNNAGGIEGGMTNGEKLVITAAMKPIPTMATPLNSVNNLTNEAQSAHFERADTCAVEACATVALNMAAIVLLNTFLERYGCDNYEQIKKAYGNGKK